MEKSYLELNLSGRRSQVRLLLLVSKWLKQSPLTAIDVEINVLQLISKMLFIDLVTDRFFAPTPSKSEPLAYFFA